MRRPHLRGTGPAPARETRLTPPIQPALGDPIYVPCEAGAKKLEKYRKLVEAALNDVTAKRLCLGGCRHDAGHTAIDCEVVYCEVALLATTRVLVCDFV